MRSNPLLVVLEVRRRCRADGDVVARLLVEREEAHDPAGQDGPADTAPLRLSYKKIPAMSFGPARFSGCFDASYSRTQKRGSPVSPSMTMGAVHLDLPGLEGHRIGTYLLNEVVQWVKRWPDAHVNSISLLPA
jgi:hypothetical protein